VPRQRLRVCDDGFTLPLDWLTLSTVVYGSSGSGKTVFGKVCAEEAHKAGVRFCVIDIKGDYYGLKSTADGKGDGIPVVIFGGDHAELPLAKDKDKIIQQASFIAELVASSPHSFIIDLEHLSKGKQIAFLGTFFERLYEANREPLLLIMDEAQRYAPQKPQPGVPTVTLGAVEDIVKLGRKHGIGRLLLTQRGSGLSKETSEICDMMVAFRTPGTLDQTRAKDWLNANVTKDVTDEVMPLISGLDTGQAIFASNHPDLRKGRQPMMHVGQVRRSETFDSSATPRIGKRKLEPKRLAKADLEALTATMAEYIEEAERNDPAKLQALLKKLERDVASKDRLIEERNTHITRLGEALGEYEKTINEMTEQVENPLIEMHQVIPVGLIEELETLVGYLSDLGEERLATAAQTLDRIWGVVQNLQDHIKELKDTGAAIEELEKPKPYSDRQRPQRPGTGQARVPAATPPPRRQQAPKAPLAAPAVTDVEGREGLNGAQRKVLDSVGWWNAVGVRLPTKQQVGLIAGYRTGKKIGGNYSNVLGQLRGMELIDYPEEGHVALTEKGATMAEVIDIELSESALQAAIYAKLQEVERKVAKVMVGAYPESLDKREAGRMAGYSVGDKVGGNYSNVLGRLRSLGMIDYPTKGTVRATPVWFLEEALV
jgi:hypothetical protein